MISFEHVLAHMSDLDGAELARWIENRWVLPENAGGTYVFHEVDFARVRLIHELRRDFELNDDALAIVPLLLDQVYDLRRQLRRVCGISEERRVGQEGSSTGRSRWSP